MTYNQVKHLSIGETVEHDIVGKAVVLEKSAGIITQEPVFLLKLDIDGDLESFTTQEMLEFSKHTRCRVVWRGYHTVVAQCYINGEWHKPHEYDTYDFRDEFEENDSVIVSKIES